MALWPSSITIAGTLIPLDNVLADVTVHHGRVDIMDDPTATTLQLTLYDVDHTFVKAFHVGAPLVFKCRDGLGPEQPRFTGRVTDATLASYTDIDGGEHSDLTAIATARLSTLADYPVGAVPWPVETWSARLARIFAEAGLTAYLDFRPDPTFDPQLAARDPETADVTTLADYLTFLMPMIGGAVVDKPDGKILVQAIGARTLAASVTIDPADVSYAPAWTETRPQGNIITVRYTGDQSESVTVQDDVSVEMYGPIRFTIDTSFVDVADATKRAQTRLARSAFAHWNITDAPILRGLLLEVGAPIALTSMPPASPYDPWTPILEGWTDTITGEDWTMQLALSDPLASALVLPWNAVPNTPVYQWNAVNPATSWSEALTLEDLANA